MLDGLKGYTDQSWRVSILIAEITLVCNTLCIHKAFDNGTFGYRFSVDSVFTQEISLALSIETPLPIRP